MVTHPGGCEIDKADRFAFKSVEEHGGEGPGRPERLYLLRS